MATKFTTLSHGSIVDSETRHRNQNRSYTRWNKAIAAFDKVPTEKSAAELRMAARDHDKWHSIGRDKYRGITEYAERGVEMWKNNPEWLRPMTTVRNVGAAMDTFSGGFVTYYKLLAEIEEKAEEFAALCEQAAEHFRNARKRLEFGGLEVQAIEAWRKGRKTIWGG